MINSIHESFSSHSNTTRQRLILLSPIAVILLGQLATRTAGPAIGVWSWVPLNFGYWTVITLLIGWGGGRQAIKRWLQPSQGSWLWPLLGIIIAAVPTVPMLFPNTWRLFLQLQIWLPTLLFVIINPCAEEGYWRGLLLDAVGNKNKWLAVLYSSALFTINHMWISVMVIGARNPMASIFQDTKPAMATGCAPFDKSVDPDSSRLSQSVYSWHAIMKFALLTQILIGFPTLLILVIVVKRKVFDQPKYVALFFLFYFIDNLAIAFANHHPNLQITPNRLWEGFLLWGWSGKIYSIVSVLFLLYAVRPVLPFQEIGLTLRQHQGSIVPSLAIILLIALGSLAIGALSPKGKFDSGLLLYLAILPGLNEELVYRGTMPACLDKLFPRKWNFASAKIGWSAIITTVMFGLLHGLWLDDHFELQVEIVWIRNALLSGFIFAWLRDRTGSLIMPIVAHGAWDFFLFLPRMI